MIHRVDKINTQVMRQTTSNKDDWLGKNTAFGIDAGGVTVYVALLKSMSFKTLSYINYELEIWVALDSVIVTRLVTLSQ